MAKIALWVRIRPRQGRYSGERRIVEGKGQATCFKLSSLGSVDEENCTKGVSSTRHLGSVGFNEVEITIIYMQFGAWPPEQL